jgi:hypothetical protein
MDSSHLFMPEEDLALTEKTSNLTSENMTTERAFKLKVLEWLTNGKVKLFRSPAEGNYIVRLMNTSLTPNDTLGRMIHTFNSTAYEIAKCTTENLEYYGLIDARENLSTQTRWTTIDIYEKSKVITADPGELITLNDKMFYSASFTDMRPGTIFYLDGQPIQIGATGAYSVSSQTPFEKIQIKKQDMHQGLVTYSYKSKVVNVFGMIEQVHIEDVPIQQHIGSYPQLTPQGGNFLASLEDVKTEVLHISFIRFKKREARDIFINVSYEDYLKYGRDVIDVRFHAPDTRIRFYSDMDCLHEIRAEDLDVLCLYQLRFRRTDYRFYYENQKNPTIYLEPFIKEDHIVDRTSPYFAPYSPYYYDPVTNIIDDIVSSTYDIVIDGEIINIAETGEYQINHLAERKPDLRLNPGIITEISYSKQIVTYSFESDDFTVKEAKAAYTSFYDRYKTDYAGGKKAAVPLPVPCPKTLEELEYYQYQVDDMQTATKRYYRNFTSVLQQTIDNYKEANGIV